MLKVDLNKNTGKVIGWVPNLLKLNLTQYSIMAGQTFTVQQEYHEV